MRDEPEEAAELKVGTAVEADYKGKGKYYAGKISRVRLNGTYDIDYDDGEKELGVAKSLIKAKARYADFFQVNFVCGTNRIVTYQQSWQPFSFSSY